jgi:hypothetical protein
LKEIFIDNGHSEGVAHRQEFEGVFSTETEGFTKRQACGRVIYPLVQKILEIPVLSLSQ